MKKCFFFIVVILCPGLMRSQDKILYPGDKVPDIIFNNLINYKNSSLKLSDLHSRVVILDFWTTFCAPCIEEFPRYDSLQKFFGDELSILLITPERRESIIKFWKSNPHTKNLSLASVTDDSVLVKLFDVTMIPQIVWLRNGVVHSYTDVDMVKAEKIQALMNDSTVQWQQTKKLGKFNYDAPLLSLNKSLVGAPPPFYGTVTAYLPGLQPQSKLFTDSANGYRRLYVINQGIANLYRNTLALAKLHLLKQQVVLDVRDSSQYFRPRGTLHSEWNKKFMHCYDAVVPVAMNDSSLREKLITDLNHYLGLRADIKRMNHPCYILRRIPGRKIRAAGGKDKSLPLPTLVSIWQELSPHFPIINESGYAENITNLDILTLEELQQQLPAYGLELIEGKREMAVLTISDR